MSCKNATLANEKPIIHYFCVFFFTFWPISLVSSILYLIFAIEKHSLATRRTIIKNQIPEVMTEKFTTNRKMTSGLRPWLAALFCVAALTACKNKDGFTTYDAATEIAKLDLAEAQPFTIDVNVRATGQDSCLSVFLADDFVHFGETEPCVTVPITGESFQISIPLKRMRAARIRGVDATGNLTETSADLWLVPGETIKADAFSPKTTGELLYFFEIQCAVSALLSGVNPFDQPGVEAYKKEMRAYINEL